MNSTAVTTNIAARDYNFTVWHLTPTGWVTGDHSDRWGFGDASAIERPANALVSVKHEETMKQVGTGYKKLTVIRKEVWRATSVTNHDINRIQREYGTCPQHL